MLDTPPLAHLEPVKAAQYVRMSTEHQRYSTQNQADVIAKYAREHNMSIVRTFADDGKSGLNLGGRSGLLELLSEVQKGHAEFNAILVYDVSRWGRFQDADESGYWEYVCKRAGVTIQYCAEQFVNDGSMSSVILKNLKRTMAGEYSRELSVKVFAGQCRLVELGYRQGGRAGYGLRRLLIDEQNQPKHVLNPGDRKSLQTDRVVLIPGPEEEQLIVREIYHRFSSGGCSEAQIAADLNLRGIPGEIGQTWTRGLVHQILINHKYIGSNVFNRRSFKLKQRRVVNPEPMWVRRDGAFPAVVSEVLFSEAARIIESRSRKLSDDEMLGKLADLLSRKGILSGILIDEEEQMPSSSAYRNRFGTLTRAYSLVGYTPERDISYIETNRALRELYRAHFIQIVGELRATGASVHVNDPADGVLNINQDFSAVLIIARCHTYRSGSHRWLIRLERRESDLTIAARMNHDNKEVLDYYLLPSTEELNERVRLARDNPLTLDVYRFENLNSLYSVSRRVRIGDT